MIARYFAYGSNMNPERVRQRGLDIVHLAGARLEGFALAFDKTSSAHPGLGHANLVLAPGRVVEGVLYWLRTPAEIGKMDRFESAPVNYSREVIGVRVSPDDGLPGGPEPTSGDQALITTWTYFANPAVRQAGLRPPRSYLNHLLAGRPFLSAGYYAMLAAWPCEESR